MFESFKNPFLESFSLSELFVEPCEKYEDQARQEKYEDQARQVRLKYGHFVEPMLTNTYDKFRKEC